MFNNTTSFSKPVYRSKDDSFLKFHGILINNNLFLGLSGVGKTTLSSKLPDNVFYFDEMISLKKSSLHSRLVWDGTNARRIVKKIFVLERNIQDQLCSFNDFLVHLHSDFPWNKKLFLKRALEAFSFYKVYKTDINTVLKRKIY